MRIYVCLPHSFSIGLRFAAHLPLPAPPSTDTHSTDRGCARARQQMTIVYSWGQSATWPGWPENRNVARGRAGQLGLIYIINFEYFIVCLGKDTAGGRPDRECCRLWLWLCAWAWARAGRGMRCDQAGGAAASTPSQEHIY